MISFSDVLIIGAGHGGAQAAIALRQRDFKGSITILGEEPDYPYERPPPSARIISLAKRRSNACSSDRNPSGLSARSIS